MDPWGGETATSSNQAFQPHRFTTYERDANGGDDAMMRRYAGSWMRFSQPDPYDGSYDPTDPQSFNRYSYVQNDPVNFVDPTGLCGYQIPYINWSDGSRTFAPGSISNCSVNVGSYSDGVPGIRGDTGMTPEAGPPGEILENPSGGPTGAEIVPQNPSPTPTPTPCPGSIPEAAAIQILAIAAQEGVDPTLLSVTWRHESSFTGDPPPNPRYEGRGRNRHIVGYDVGPMQTATNVWNRAPFTDGLSDPFGTIAMSRSTRQYVGFNGSVSDNLTLGARAFSLDILNRSRSLADAAGLYRAGSRTGPGYQQRYNEYTREAPGDRTQLNCLANRR